MELMVLLVVEVHLEVVEHLVQVEQVVHLVLLEYYP
jgi:hypothetical protein